MVVQGAKSRIADAVAPGEKSTLSCMFSHASTFRAVNRGQIRGSYLLVIIYAALVSAVVLSVAALAILAKGGLAMLERAAPSLALSTCSLTIVLVVSSFFAAWINCWFVGRAIGPKEHLIFASSMTYLPLVVGLHFLSDVAASIGTFALLLLNSYYLNASYQEYIDTSDTRSTVIHQVYTFVAYLTMIYLCQFSFTAFISLGKP